MLSGFYSENFKKKLSEIMDTEINRQADRRSKEASKEDVKRELFGGFDVGDTCYIVKLSQGNNKCFRCNDDYIKLKYNEVDNGEKCTVCKGTRMIPYDIYVPIKGIVTSVQCKVQRVFNSWSGFYEIKTDILIEVKSYSSVSKYHPKDLYKTKVECQTICESLMGRGW